MISKKINGQFDLFEVLLLGDEDTFHQNELAIETIFFIDLAVT